ncbi:MAG TPA: hypothetical protein VMI54_08930 [Polyangiaceae bacterium]|nr:hypothetical protein [Polyangiaceae bacterium]
MRPNALLFSILCGCQSHVAFAPEAHDTPEACEARKQSLVNLVAAMPERALATDLHTDLPQTSLGTAPGAGPVLEVTESSLALDGERLDPAAWAARAKTLPEHGVLYVAAAYDTTIHAVRTAVAPVPSNTTLKLLVRTPGAPLPDANKTSRGDELAARVLAAADPAQRKALAEQGYAEFSNCPALASAVAAAGTVPSNARWPKLRAGLSEALPACACSSMDAPALRALVSAEQRAGTAALAALPLDFVRDERCDASMGLRSVKRLLEQMEQFDAEYAGKITDSDVRFEQIITSDHLLVEFCDALPGETLASLERKKATLYWRVAGSAECEAWTFAPMAPGAPMGTWRRAATAQNPAAAFHYWQAAEEISVFGPVASDPPSKPTDEREWPCRQNFKLIGIDGDGVTLETGRWFFTDAACHAANETPATAGCTVTEPHPSAAATR